MSKLVAWMQCPSPLASMASSRQARHHSTGPDPCPSLSLQDGDVGEWPEVKSVKGVKGVKGVVSCVTMKTTLRFVTGRATPLHGGGVRSVHTVVVRAVVGCDDA